MDLAERIREARAQSGLSQRELALRIESSKRSIAHWEGGQRTPEFTFVVRIARATNTPLDYFAEAVA